jgi:hypothetical protein
MLCINFMRKWMPMVPSAGVTPHSYNPFNTCLFNHVGFFWSPHFECFCMGGGPVWVPPANGTDKGLNLTSSFGHFESNCMSRWFPPFQIIYSLSILST